MQFRLLSCRPRTRRHRGARRIGHANAQRAPAAALSNELATSVQDGFTIATVGDLIRRFATVHGPRRRLSGRAEADSRRRCRHRQLRRQHHRRPALPGHRRRRLRRTTGSGERSQGHGLGSGRALEQSRRRSTATTVSSRPTATSTRPAWFTRVPARKLRRRPRRAVLLHAQRTGRHGGHGVELRGGDHGRAGPWRVAGPRRPERAAIHPDLSDAAGSWQAVGRSTTISERHRLVRTDRQRGQKSRFSASASAGPAGE